jgi:hypothetical protein
MARSSSRREFDHPYVYKTLTRVIMSLCMLSRIVRISSGEREQETVAVNGSGRYTVGIALSIFGKILREIREASIAPCRCSVWLVSSIWGDSRVGLFAVGDDFRGLREQEIFYQYRSC